MVPSKKSKSSSKKPKSKKLSSESKKPKKEPNPCNIVFGQYLAALLEGPPKLSQRALIDKLKEYQEYKPSFISQILKGTTSPPKNFIAQVAQVFGIDEKVLLCHAGRPPDDVLLALAHNTSKVLSLIGTIATVKIGVVKILWAAHIYAVPETNKSWDGNTQFVCKEYDTGKQALTAMLEGEVQFATVTKEAVESHPQKDSIFFVLDFFSSKKRDMYYLYKILPEISKESKQVPVYAYLSNSILEPIAKEQEGRKRKEHRFKGHPVNSVEQLVEAIKNKEVNGFYAWPPLDEQVVSLCLLSGHKAELREKEIQAFVPPSTTLYLVTTYDFIQRVGAAVMTDLAFRIISAKSTSEDEIWKILKRRMSYLSEKHREKLRGVTFDVNIEAEAFKRMMVERALWVTVTEHSEAQKS